MDRQPGADLDDPTRGPGVGGHGALRSDGPQEGRPCSGDDDHDVMGVCAPRPAWSAPWTPSPRRLPPEVLETLREVCPAAWPRAAHVGRIARRPGPFEQGPAGLQVAGCGEAALAT